MMTSLLGRIDTALLARNILQFFFVSVLCASLIIIEQALMFTPLILGLFIAYQNLDRQRIRYIGFFLMPLLFLIVFISGGGLIPFRNDIDSIVGQEIAWAFIGVWCSQLIVLIIWLFYKIKPLFSHFILTAFLVLPPYLIGLHPTNEYNNSLFLFYFLWNMGLAIGLSLIISRR